MSFEKYLRQKQIEKEAKEAASKSVNEVVRKMMRSELFEETLKQHKNSLTDELVKLGKHRQAQLAEWDIEQNESDYEFYFSAGWNAQQSKVEELTLQVAEMKSRLNDAYTDEQSAMYTARQSKIDELTKQRDSFIKAYEIEMDKSIELQKIVDAVKTLIEEYKDPPTEYKAFRYALSIVAYELE